MPIPSATSPDADDRCRYFRRGEVTFRSSRFHKEGYIGRHGGCLLTRGPSDFHARDGAFERRSSRKHARRAESAPLGNVRYAFPCDTLDLFGEARNFSGSKREQEALLRRGRGISTLIFPGYFPEFSISLSAFAV